MQLARRLSSPVLHLFSSLPAHSLPPCLIYAPRLTPSSSYTPAQRRTVLLGVDVHGGSWQQWVASNDAGKRSEMPCAANDGGESQSYTADCGLMSEVPMPGEYHGNAGCICGSDDFFISHGATGLNARSRACINGGL